MSQRTQHKSAVKDDVDKDPEEKEKQVQHSEEDDEHDDDHDDDDHDHDDEHDSHDGVDDHDSTDGEESDDDERPSISLVADESKEASRKRRVCLCLFSPVFVSSCSSDIYMHSQKEQSDEQLKSAPVSSTKQARIGSHSSEQEQDKSDDKSDDDDELVNVTFEFFDPRPDDFYSVKRLLLSYIDGVSEPKAAKKIRWDGDLAQELAQLIANQVTVGTMAKTEQSDQPLAFISALNMHVHKVARMPLPLIADALNMDDCLF
jgi:hypothetical protein